MHTMLAQLWIDAPHENIIHLWEVVWLHGETINNQLLSDPVQKLNSESWLIGHVNIIVEDTIKRAWV